eukprot:Ihof_evm1s501 gene=Ihof_evmTU1s501
MKEAEKKLVVALVGLPAHGKTYIASKLCHYLKWNGHNTRIFNTGMYRQIFRNEVPGLNGIFDPEHPNSIHLREQVRKQALDDLINWLNTEGYVGIYDASNVTREEREVVRKRCLKEAQAEVFFIESVYTSEEIIRANLAEFKKTSPTYKEYTEEEAMEDFKKRTEGYKKRYEPMSLELDSGCSFLKMIDVGEKMVCNAVHGYLQTGIAYFLMNIHTAPRTIYLVRHGESEFNVEGRIGGDSDLSPRGRQYAKALAKYMKELDPPNLQVWTSTMVRTISTAQFISPEIPKKEWRCLEEIDAGICDGMTYEQIGEKFPDDFASRDVDKYNYRYPKGESYHDIVVRLEPITMELERAHNVLVIAHQAVLRCLLAYFLDLPAEDLPYIKVPLHTVMKLGPIAYGCRVEQ